MATTLTQDLDSIKQVEDKLTTNKVAQFAYTQEAYNDPEHYADGVQAYNVNNPNNIPVADASILKVNETVLSKGYRSQASSITRMLLNHFLGRTSYNLNKANDLIKSLVSTIKTNLGQANGFATLDSNGRIPYSQLPESAIEFKGAWNAQTNTPALVDGTGTKGDFYVVSVAGTQDLGSGDIQFFVNDRVIYDGEVWQRLSAGDVKTVNNILPVDGNITLTKGDIGLGNVDNTSDANKPVSTAQQEAIDNAIATAENLSNATGKLDIEHGGTNATTTDEARANLNINNVVNTGDSATPTSGGTTKFTTGGAYTELLKKANTIEGISAVDTLAFPANTNVFIQNFVNSIILKVPRDAQNSIVKFVTNSAKAVNIVFDSTTPLPSGAVKISSDGLIIIGNLVRMNSTTSNLDMSLIFLDKNKTFYTCRVVQNGSHVVTASISQSQASLVFDSIPTDNSSNPVTSSGIYNAIKSAIEALDVNSVGGDGKYIESISETNGKISATAQSMDTTPTANSTKAVTSGGIKTAIDSAVETAEDLSNATGILAVTHGGTGTNAFDTVPTAGSDKPVTSGGIKTAIDGRLPDVVNTGDSAVPEEDGTRKFTTGGAFNFLKTRNPTAWLGAVFADKIGHHWKRTTVSGTHNIYGAFTTDVLAVTSADGTEVTFMCGTARGLLVGMTPVMLSGEVKAMVEAKGVYYVIVGNTVYYSTDPVTDNANNTWHSLAKPSGITNWYPMNVQYIDGKVYCSGYSFDVDHLGTEVRMVVLEIQPESPSTFVTGLSFIISNYSLANGAQSDFNLVKTKDGTLYIACYDRTDNTVETGYIFYKRPTDSIWKKHTNTLGKKFFTVAYLYNRDAVMVITKDVAGSVVLVDGNFDTISGIGSIDTLAKVRVFSDKAVLLGEDSQACEILDGTRSIGATITAQNNSYRIEDVFLYKNGASLEYLIQGYATSDESAKLFAIKQERLSGGTITLATKYYNLVGVNSSGECILVDSTNKSICRNNEGLKTPLQIKSNESIAKLNYSNGFWIFLCLEIPFVQDNPIPVLYSSALTEIEAGNIIL